MLHLGKLYHVTRRDRVAIFSEMLSLSRFLERERES